MQGACLSLPPALVQRVLATTTSHLQFGLHRSRHDAPTARASWRLLDGARRWRMQGACLSLPPALVQRVLATTTSHLPFGEHRSRHGAPTHQASLRLLHGVRRWRMQGACLSLPPVLNLERAPVEGTPTCESLTLKRVEIKAVKTDPCSYSTVRGGSGSKVRARLCRQHSRGKCLPPRPAVWSATELCHGAPTARASLRLHDGAR